MVRWRFCLVLAMLMLLPTRIGSKLDEDDDDDQSIEIEQSSTNVTEITLSNRLYSLLDDGCDHDVESDDEEEDDDDDVDEEQDKSEVKSHLSKATTSMVLVKREKKQQRPLECFVCVYKAEMPLKSCLDPTKFRVHTITCHNLEDRCFTAVVPKGNTYESVLRGCRSGCIGTPDTTCCELNRCNSQAFALPENTVKMRSDLMDDNSFSSDLSITKNSAAKPVSPTVLFFVTVLLFLQTVVKVAFV